MVKGLRFRVHATENWERCRVFTHHPCARRKSGQKLSSGAVLLLGLKYPKNRSSKVWVFQAFSKRLLVKSRPYAPQVAPQHQPGAGCRVQGGGGFRPHIDHDHLCFTTSKFDLACRVQGLWFSNRELVFVVWILEAWRLGFRALVHGLRV